HRARTDRVRAERDHAATVTRRAVAGRAVDAVPLLTALDEGGHATLPLDDRRRDLEDPARVVVGAAGGVRDLGIRLDREGALDLGAHGATVLEERSLRLRVVPRLVVHVPDGNDGRLLRRVADGAGEHRGNEERENGDASGHATASSTSWTWLGPVDSRSERVRSRSNFGSSTSMEMKNLSSVTASKRSDSKMG